MISSAPAVDIAQLYKGRWQIELLFRWIKQHLKIRKFLGNNDNAIRLQLFAAMIAYALLRIVARSRCITIPILRFTELVLNICSRDGSTQSTSLHPSIQSRTNRPILRSIQMAFHMHDFSPDSPAPAGRRKHGRNADDPSRPLQADAPREAVFDCCLVEKSRRRRTAPAKGLEAVL